MIPDTNLNIAELRPKLNRAFDLAAAKITDIHNTWNPKRGTPVFTREGQYTTRGWCEWTQGFQYGSALLTFDATDDQSLLKIGRESTLHRMAPHLTHTGVHDHGFNNVSTYGTLRRLLLENKIPHNPWEQHFYELALKVSGAVQASRWSTILDPETKQRSTGYIHSFNGPHSLFSDTIRSLRSLCVSWKLGHYLMAENDLKINLLHRGIQHAQNTAAYNVYYGKNRDRYDTPAQAGRVVHESIFNMTDGAYRCPSTQQGYSPFSTWTRGLAWILTGYAEQLEFLDTLSPEDTRPVADLSVLTHTYLTAARATADWYIKNSFSDGMVYWDAGAPNIPNPSDYSNSPPDPCDTPEPIDSSAAAIAAQGFFRLANYLTSHNQPEPAAQYHAAALTIAHTLFDEPYLSTDPAHQGLLLHSIYHHPNAWDHEPTPNQPHGESSQWGDYHALELALLLHRSINDFPYITFFS